MSVSYEWKLWSLLHRLQICHQNMIDTYLITPVTDWKPVGLDFFKEICKKVGENSQSGNYKQENFN